MVLNFSGAGGGLFPASSGAGYGFDADVDQENLVDSGEYGLWTTIGVKVLKAASQTIEVKVPRGFRMFWVLCVGKLTAGTQLSSLILNADETNNYVSQVITSIAPNVTSVQVNTGGIDACEVDDSFYSSFLCTLFDMGSGADVAYQGHGGYYAKSVDSVGHWANNEINSIKWKVAASTLIAGSSMTVYGVR